MTRSVVGVGGMMLSLLAASCSNGGGGGPDAATDATAPSDAADAGEAACACVDGGRVPMITVLDNAGTSLVSWPATASGDVAPATTIAGAQTNLTGALAVSADADGNLYVAIPLAILVFPPGANGDVAPSRTIAGPSALAATDYFAGVAVAPDGTIYAASELTSGTNRSPKLLVFPPGTNGNVAPSQTITGAATTMQATLAMAVQGTLLAEADATQKILFFNTTDTGNVAPQRSLGSGNGIVDGLQLGAAGQSYVALYGFGGSSASIYAPGAANADAPLHTLAGATTGITSIGGIATDIAGYTYVANADPAGAAILVFAPNASGDVAPVRSIAGASTTLAGDASQYPMPIVLY